MPSSGGRAQECAAPVPGPVLEVYVADDCLGCVRARELVAALRRARAGADVRTIDVDRSPEDRPAGLVGTPTYRLGGRVRWLGNPAEDQLLAVWDDEARRSREEAERRCAGEGMS